MYNYDRYWFMAKQSRFIAVTLFRYQLSNKYCLIPRLYFSMLFNSNDNRGALCYAWVLCYARVCATVSITQVGLLAEHHINRKELISNFCECWTN